LLSIIAHPLNKSHTNPHTNPHINSPTNPHANPHANSLANPHAKYQKTTRRLSTSYLSFKGKNYMVVEIRIASDIRRHKSILFPLKSVSLDIDLARCIQAHPPSTLGKLLLSLISR
jgi:hypothetical protein